jgi:hypothetical protein
MNNNGNGSNVKGLSAGFTMVPNEWIESDLTDGGVRVLCAIAAHCFGTNSCIASTSRLARITNKTRSTVKRQVRILESKNRVRKIARKTECGDPDTNELTPRYPEGWVHQRPQGGCTSDPTGGCTNDPRVGAPVTPEEYSYKNTVLEQHISNTMRETCRPSVAKNLKPDPDHTIVWTQQINAQKRELIHDLSAHAQVLGSVIENNYTDKGFREHMHNTVLVTEELDNCVDHILAYEKTQVVNLANYFNSWLRRCVANHFESWTGYE